MLPERLGPYRIERRLGEGGMGEVFQARHDDLDRPVALKTLFGLGVEDLERFAREAQLLAKVDHPAVVKVHTLDRSGRTPFLVTELIDGKSLLDLAAGHPLPWEEALDMVCQLAEGVAAIHAQGILHRDLKPSNAMRRADGQVVLLDFGLARELDGESLTQTGAIMGTPAYMPPEQALGAKTETVDARADVYGLGGILYFLLSGHPPFRGALIEVLNAVIHKAPDWAALRGVPRPVAAVLKKALAKTPADRYPDADALRLALREAVAAPPGLPRGALYGAAALTVLALSLGAFAWGRGTRVDPPSPPPPELTKRGPPQPAPPRAGALPAQGRDRLALYLEVLRSPASKERETLLSRLSQEALWVLEPGLTPGLTPGSQNEIAIRAVVAFAGPTRLVVYSHTWHTGLTVVDLDTGARRPLLETSDPRDAYSRSFATALGPEGWEVWHSVPAGVLRTPVDDPSRVTTLDLGSTAEDTPEGLWLNTRATRMALRKRTGTKGKYSWKVWVVDPSAPTVPLAESTFPNEPKDVCFLDAQRTAVAYGSLHTFTEGGSGVRFLSTRGPDVPPEIAPTAFCLAWSRERGLLATGLSDGNVLITRPGSPAEENPPLSTLMVRGVAFTHDGLWWVTGTNANKDGASEFISVPNTATPSQLRKWSLTTARVTVARTPGLQVNDMASSQAGLLAVGGYEGKIELWTDPPPPEPSSPGLERLRHYVTYGQEPRGPLWRGPLLPSAGEAPILLHVVEAGPQRFLGSYGRPKRETPPSKQVIVVDLLRGLPQRVTFERPVEAATAAIWEGRWHGFAATFSLGKCSVFAWPLAEAGPPKVVAGCKDLTAFPYALAVSSQGAIVVGSNDGKLVIRGPNTKKPVVDLGSAGIRSLRFLDDTRLAYTTEPTQGHGQWGLVDVARGTSKSYRAPKRGLHYASIAYDPIHDRLALGSSDSQVRLVDPHSGRVLHSLDLLSKAEREKPHPDTHRVWSLAFLSGGDVVCAAAGDRGAATGSATPPPLRFFSTHTGELLATIDLDVAAHRLIRFDRDTLLIGGYDGSLLALPRPKALKESARQDPVWLDRALPGRGPKRLAHYQEVADALERTRPGTDLFKRLTERLTKLARSPLMVFPAPATTKALRGFAEAGACWIEFLSDTRLARRRLTEDSLVLVDLVGETHPLPRIGYRPAVFKRTSSETWSYARVSGPRVLTGTLRWEAAGKPRMEEEEQPAFDLEGWLKKELPERSSSGPKPELSSLTLSDDARIIAVGGNVDHVFLIDRRDPKTVRPLKTQHRVVCSLAFQGDRLFAGMSVRPAVGSTTGPTKLHAWFLNGKVLPSEVETSGDTNALATHALGDLVVSGDGTGRVRLHRNGDFSRGSALALDGLGSANALSRSVAGTRSHEADISSVFISLDGRRLVSITGAGSPGEARVWDVASGRPLSPVLPLRPRVDTDRGPPIEDSALSPDERLMAVGFRDERVQIWVNPAQLYR